MTAGRTRNAEIMESLLGILYTLKTYIKGAILSRFLEIVAFR